MDHECADFEECDENVQVASKVFKTNNSSQLQLSKGLADMHSLSKTITF